MGRFSVLEDYKVIVGNSYSLRSYFPGLGSIWVLCDIHVHRPHTWLQTLPCGSTDGYCNSENVATHSEPHIMTHEANLQHQVVDGSYS